jgi:hypothetical protein
VSGNRGSVCQPALTRFDRLKTSSKTPWMGLLPLLNLSGGCLLVWVANHFLESVCDARGKRNEFFLEEGC